MLKKQMSIGHRSAEQKALCVYWQPCKPAQGTWKLKLQTLFEFSWKDVYDVLLLSEKLDYKTICRFPILVAGWDELVQPFFVLKAPKNTNKI